MKQLHFYEKGECGTLIHIKNWREWTGEVPQQGDRVLIRMSDNKEDVWQGRVICRIIDETKPEDIDIVISWLK